MKRSARTSTEFEELVTQAVQLERDLRALGTLAGSKLSATAFQREADRIANLTPESRTQLRKQIESATDASALLQSLRRAIRFIRTENCTGPTDELRRLRFLSHPDADREMARFGTDMFGIFALAVEDCAARWPETFGTSESKTDHQQRLQAIARQRDELFEKIATSYTPADLLVSDVDAQGRGHVSFAMTRGAIPIYPLSNAGERLVNWKISQGHV